MVAGCVPQLVTAGWGGVTGSGTDGGRVLGWVGTDGSWVSLARRFVPWRARFVL